MKRKGLSGLHSTRTEERRRSEEEIEINPGQQQLARERVQDMGDESILDQQLKRQIEE